MNSMIARVTFASGKVKDFPVTNVKASPASTFIHLRNDPYLQAISFERANVKSIEILVNDDMLKLEALELLTRAYDRTSVTVDNSRPGCITTVRFYNGIFYVWYDNQAPEVYSFKNFWEGAEILVRDWKERQANLLPES